MYRVSCHGVEVMHQQNCNGTRSGFDSIRPTRANAKPAHQLISPYIISPACRLTQPRPKKKTSRRQAARFHSVASIPPHRFTISQPYLKKDSSDRVDQRQSQTHAPYPHRSCCRVASHSLALKQNPPKIKQSPNPKTEETKLKERGRDGRCTRRAVGNIASPSRRSRSRFLVPFVKSMAPATCAGR
jgi:hypothetical protein